MNNKANILVVDDERGPRESLMMILKPYYNVYTAERGAQAIELVNQIPVDLITVDLKMPGLPGIKVLEQIKQQDPDIEAIVITGYGSLDTAVQGIRLGAFDYIDKPFDVNHILALVKRALERRYAKLRLKELKSNFLANVSHELRTPLSVVVGFVYLLLNQVIGKLTDEQQKVLEKVYRNSGELLDLIDNVLWMTSLNAGDFLLGKDEFDVVRMIREAAKTFEGVMQEKEVQFSLQLPEEELLMVSDRSKVERIFKNLLNNAVKFTPRGHITVKVQRSADGMSIDLEVIDTGIGMDQTQIETMFEPFQQMDGSTQREFSGLGLGLTVARRLTEFLGGTLRVQSQPGAGTHAIVSLPYLAKSYTDSMPVEGIRAAH
ncbi:MAG TPA: ATP-binding protein [Candidatus Binatia bacterium]|nr:ATP-binding protein [Candidatus Binatia bacterium]